MGVMEMNRTKRTIRVVTPESLWETLGKFERVYELPSEEFVLRWKAGVLDDRRDFFRWHSACHLAMKMGVPPRPNAEWHAVR